MNLEAEQKKGDIMSEQHFEKHNCKLKLIDCILYITSCHDLTVAADSSSKGQQ